jgi:large subunit ribosomal protein L31
MKKDIHPENNRLVIFHDNSNGARFLVPSTIETEETDKWEDGNEYPLYKVEISSASHPFFTGQEKTVDTAGRIDKFKARMQAAQAKSPKAKKQASAPVNEEAATEA